MSEKKYESPLDDIKKPKTIKQWHIQKKEQTREPNNMEPIIYTERIKKTEIQKDGSILTTFELKHRNVTESINETKDLIKTSNMQIMLAKLEELEGRIQ